MLDALFLVDGNDFRISGHLGSGVLWEETGGWGMFFGAVSCLWPLSELLSDVKRSASLCPSCCDGQQPLAKIRKSFLQLVRVFCS